MSAHPRNPRNPEHANRADPTAPATGDAVETSAPARRRPSRIAALHARLRGRYRYAAVAALLVGAIAAVAVYRTQTPVYRAQATVLVTADDDAVTDDPSIIARLVDRTAQLARSRPMAAAALDDSALDADARATFGTPEAFARRVHVVQADGAAGVVTIAFDDTDPAAAESAAGAIARGLQAAHQRALNADVASIESLQAETIEQLERRKSAQQQRAALLAAAGPVPIDQAYEAQLAELDRVRAARSQAELDLAELGPTGRAPRDAAGAPPEAVPTLEQLALTDRRLASLLLTRREIERRLADAADRLGPQSPALARLKNDLAAVQTQIDQYAAADNDPLAFIRPAAGADGQADVLPTPDAATALRARIQRLDGLEQEARADLAILAETRTVLGQLADADADADRRVTEARVHIDRIRALANARGTIEVTEPALGTAALHNDRRPLVATIAGVGGLLGTFLIACGLLALDGRMRRPSADLFGDRAPLLGTVPTITPDQQDPADADVTALSIHQIRALLETRARARGEFAFAVTSPSTGSGKTSLTIGLASSLALSGTRTLLVDCELASRAMRKDGERGPEQSLDEVMLQMGYLEAEETDLFVFQDNTEIGLLGMLAGRPLERCVVQTSVPKLSILPALAADAHDIGKMSGKFIDQIIDEARAIYDVVLFDTGPIPGSIEAMLVAGAVDGVVIVASRGESQARYNKTVNYLETVGAAVAGTVFNRADRRDLTLVNERPGRVGEAKKKPEAMPFGAQRTRRLPPPPGMGSGILAAAVHAQAHTDGEPETQRDKREKPAERAASKPKAKPTPKPQAQPVEVEPERPRRAQTPDEISLADAGDIATILDEAASVAEASSDRDLSEEALERMLEGKTDPAQRAGHATPVDEHGNPVRRREQLNPDDDLRDAIDALLADADPRSPEIHVNPTNPSAARKR